MSFDHYAAVRSLAERLAAEGQADWAEKITRVVEAGATGTEIFMGLRWRLRQLGECGESLSDESKSRVDILLTELDRALGR